MHLGNIVNTDFGETGDSDVLAGPPVNDVGCNNNAHPVFPLRPILTKALKVFKGIKVVLHNVTGRRFLNTFTGLNSRVQNAN